MKQKTILSFVTSTILLFPIPSQAITVEEVTNPRQQNGVWVTDMADILSTETETKLNNMIDDFEKTNGSEIAIVTVSETSPSPSPKAFATELFNYWGIGKADTNNGILFLISKEENRVEIETGIGIQNILPNKKVKSIIDTQIIPQYKQDNFNLGTLNGTKALINSFDSISVDRQESPNRNNFIAFFQFLLLFSSLSLPLFVCLFILKKILHSLNNTTTNADRQMYKSSSDNNSSYYSSSYSSDSGSSSSFDSGSSSSFGGGSSDGCGAGGDW